MRLGLFLNFEHGPQGGAEASRHVYRDEIELALAAEAAGFEELWVSEHHFSPFSQSASVLPILAHLAGRTSQARIGPAAILMPLHDPVRVAEDLATIDLLSNGRLNLGLARGGPFPAQFKHFHVTREEAGERVVEATDFLLALLTKEDVGFDGRWFKSEGLTTFPRPQQAVFPLWMASGTKETVIQSAKRGFGLMAGQAWQISTMRGLLETYASVTDGGIPDLVVLRTACIADSDAEAHAIALPGIERFIESMRPQFGPNPPKGFTAEAFLAQAIIGSPETCRAKIQELCTAVPIGSLVLKPACLDQKMRLECVERFGQEVLA